MANVYINYHQWQEADAEYQKKKKAYDRYQEDYAYEQDRLEQWKKKEDALYNSGKSEEEIEAWYAANQEPPGVPSNYAPYPGEPPIYKEPTEAPATEAPTDSESDASTKTSTDKEAGDDTGTQSNSNDVKSEYDYSDRYPDLSKIDISQNFKLPDWNYMGYAQELRLFRKGFTSISGEPGWFYFKIIFHFDEQFGLLGNILTNQDKTIGNTAIQYLHSRSDIFVQDNLKSRALALVRFVKSLSFISSACPWFFDKVSGLDQVTPTLNEFTKEKKIDISCLPDAVDMRLTSLLHLYQFACFDEVNMKEIIPENLRKFNMSIVLYHMPIKYHSTVMGGSIPAKGFVDSNAQFSNRMSYKLYTFKGCEIDLASLGAIVPSSLDNAQPFNLGTNTISIKYDRAFTHLMNEWEQFMIGADGIYYDKKNNISPDMRDSFADRISSLILMNNGQSALSLDSLLTKGAFTSAEQGQLLGNLYDLNVMNYKYNIMMERNTSHVFFFNIFGVDVQYYKGMALARHTPKGAPAIYKGTRYDGAGISQFPHAASLGAVLKSRNQFRIYYVGDDKLSKYYLNEYDYVNKLFKDNARIYYTQYSYPHYQTSMADIVSTYKNAWGNIKGIYKQNVNSLKNVGKTLARQWGF